jgi:hypothetical protein
MVWWLWLLAGVAAGVVAFIAVIYIVDVYDDRVSARQRAVCARESEAERRMQTIMQDTIQRMFEAARWPT